MISFWCLKSRCSVWEKFASIFCLQVAISYQLTASPFAIDRPLKPSTALKSLKHVREIMTLSRQHCESIPDRDINSSPRTVLKRRKSVDWKCIFLSVNKNHSFNRKSFCIFSSSCSLSNAWTRLPFNVNALEFI